MKFTTRARYSAATLDARDRNVRRLTAKVGLPGARAGGELKREWLLFPRVGELYSDNLGRQTLPSAAGHDAIDTTLGRN